MSRLLSVRTGSRVTFKTSSKNNLRKTYNQNAQPCQPLLNRWNSSKVQQGGLQKRMVEDVKAMQSKVNINFSRNTQRRNIHQQNRFSEKEKLTAVQMNLNYQKLAETQEKNTSFFSDLTAWVLHKAKVPKGFENFFPKNKGPKNSKKSSKASNSSSKKDDPFAHIKDKKKASSSGGGKNNKDDDNQVMSAAALLLLVLAARSMIEEETTGNGREITWSDFYNHILEPGDVDRIVVINGKTARVFLKPGSPGVPLSSGGRGGTNGLPNGMGMSGSLSRNRKIDSSDPFADETVMDMGSTSESTNESSMSSTPAQGLAGRIASQPNRQLVYHFHIGSVESFEEKLSKSQQDLGIMPRDYVPVQYANETNWALELMKSAPALLMIGVMAYMMRGMGGMGGAGGGRGGMGGIFQVGKSNAKKVNKEDVNVTFADVAGCQEAKKEIMEFVDFLKDSSRFTKLGAKIPKGALLCGPPGTGKTLLAKAVAGEAGVPFFSISGSDFIEMFVGVGPSRVRDLFKDARAEAPCIIFIDEIDAVGRKRGRGNMSGGNDERENTLNQLLVEMDGFNPSTGVVVLAGTNRVDILDDALTRPGRFDRQVQVDRPDLQGRKEIFMVHLQGIKLDDNPEEFAGRLAGLTPGFSGADIANICNEAAIVAARRKADSVSIDDFEKATDRIVGGLESNKIMSKEERAIVAHHEAGHAIAGWFLEHADPLLKVTIIPRSSGALGYAQYLPKEVFLRTEEQIMHIVMMALAGRAAEEVFFGKVTTGASDDLRRVTDLVYSTIQVYGMNPRVGQLAFPKDPNSMPGDKPYSDSTAEAMDEEARKIVDDAYTNTVNLIREKKDEVEKVAKMLLDKETITHDDIIDLVGPRPFTGNEAYQEYVSKRFVKKKEAEENEEDEVEESDKIEDSNGLNPGLAFKV
ncbi:hypothetical protein CTEN210_04602 [Chaetoceros tenuissimus]|uniref:AAA+ ATPase domain-containing protein n=1 Tax=Chaetoceros tenuissimus TaxID=426638 RepID=A0AAD3CND0_9STRA|nr:hypothetical protein CTEN210_04602 [Chaetoceros tenuissimus]